MKKYGWIDDLKVNSVYTHSLGGDKPPIEVSKSIRVTAKRLGFKMSIIQSYNDKGKKILICKRVK